MSHVLHLQCRECGKAVEKKVASVCDECFGPLEVAYDYAAIAKTLSKEKIKSRPANIWRYRELLPIDGAPRAGLHVGSTPLVRADRLARVLGVRELWIKNDSVCSPSFSFKDRVVAVALSKAIEFGYKTVACASTGNLANSVAANAAAAGLDAYVFIPADLEAEKILLSKIFGAKIIGVEGNYDDVNRLCSEITNVLPWAIVNVNLRPFYAEGSKTIAYEIAEQLDWELPDHIVAPMAGGSLVTKLAKAFGELEQLGWIEENTVSLHGAQASGCEPIVSAFREGLDFCKPVKPNTIAKSLAIGNPADGYSALEAIRSSGGAAAAVGDAEILECIELLAATEGIFTETAGGVTLGATRRLIEEGKISRGSSVVLVITGNGVKTAEHFKGLSRLKNVIAPKLSEFERWHREVDLKRAPLYKNALFQSQRTSP